MKGEVGMKEITFPVLVLDDECRTCEELDIVSDTLTRMYADDKCVEQHTLVRCSNVYKCMRIQERLKKTGLSDTLNYGENSDEKDTYAF